MIDIAKDPANAKVLKRSLEQLASGGAGETLAEMAREVLQGRVSLRSAVQIPTYAESLMESSDHFASNWHKMSDSDRANLASEGARYLDEQNREFNEPSSTGESCTPKSRMRHDGKDWSLF
ncbi:hypothetical protein GQS52_11375 [Streptomyces sp. SCUT-3]|uniref:hypothetical protein n=1 Tax=unclassified Streptomyces TaxID=2593676 RepID=UPI0015FB84E8|nr:MULTISPECIES: hypothetical protein [unclassified Streptomyces]MCZ2523849.1 hypothetical protein [Streptomyces sp. HB2AG]QMV22294.1 hypothetical protein GQS52_11375 [Streptomyces sp. SCUT-3]